MAGRLALAATGLADLLIDWSALRAGPLYLTDLPYLADMLYFSDKQLIGIWLLQSSRPVAGCCTKRYNFFEATTSPIWGPYPGRPGSF